MIISCVNVFDFFATDRVQSCWVFGFGRLRSYSHMRSRTSTFAASGLIDIEYLMAKEIMLRQTIRAQSHVFSRAWHADGVLY